MELPLTQGDLYRQLGIDPPRWAFGEGPRSQRQRTDRRLRRMGWLAVVGAVSAGVAGEQWLERWQRGLQAVGLGGAAGDKEALAWLPGH